MTPMARRTRLTMTATAALAVLAHSAASAADKTTTSFVADPTCVFCTFDGLKKGSLTIASTTAPGANGLKGKFGLSGATKGGLPINGTQFVLVLRLSFNRGPCDSFSSPPFEMTNGKAKATFDGSTLTPPIPEGAGSFFFCEVGASIHNTTDGSAPAIAGVRLGTDLD
jgi:hypothetical protein